MRYLSLLLFLVVGTSGAQAKTLLISDMDDTLKVAHVRDIVSAAMNALDDKTRFAGMSELYQDLAKHSDVEIAYVSRAPEWLMKGIHQRFLVNGNFPEGYYTGRKVNDPAGDEFKLNTIRTLVDQVRPRKVILVGDNGQRDPAIYEMLAQEFRSQGIETYQFIRILYTDYLALDMVLTPMSSVTALKDGQVGFVTPVEIALELESAGILETKLADNLIAYLSRKLIKPEGQFPKNEVMFSYFQVCSDYEYSWDKHLKKNRYIPHLVEKIEFNCGVDLISR